MVVNIFQNNVLSAADSWTLAQLDYKSRLETSLRKLYTCTNTVQYSIKIHCISLYKLLYEESITMHIHRKFRDFTDFSEMLHFFIILFFY